MTGDKFQYGEVFSVAGLGVPTSAVHAIQLWRNFGLPQATISAGADIQHEGWPLCLSISRTPWVDQAKILEPDIRSSRYVSNPQLYYVGRGWSDGVTPVAIFSMFREIEARDRDQKILPIILPRGTPRFADDSEPYEHPSEVEIAGKQCGSVYKRVSRKALADQVKACLPKIPYIMLYKSFSTSADFDEDWTKTFVGLGAYVRVMEGGDHKTDIWYDPDGNMMDSAPEGDDPNQDWQHETVPDPSLLDQVWW